MCQSCRNMNHGNCSGLLSDGLLACGCACNSKNSESESSGSLSESVNHPAHYGGKDNPYEAIKVIRAWKLGFCLGNCLKYICRAGKKPGAEVLEDLKKALWYLQESINEIESQ